MATKIDLPSSSSSSSSSSCPPLPSPSCKLTYDVFLNFRGTDTRTNFTDHLYAALKQKGIYTFRDDEGLNRGESIGPNLLKAIEESRYVIVVFSQHYADSTWCLDELAKVVDCRRAMGQIVFPVFYGVDPFEVRRQRGQHFGKAFEKHQERFGGNPDKLQRWKDALAEVSDLSGWHLQDGYQSKVIQEIVKTILTELNQISPIFEGLVGMDSHLNEMSSYLAIGCRDVRIIGICGMSGIGKTTIAQVVFEMVKAQFEGCSFLENVREVTEKQGAVHLQKQLLSNLLKFSVNVDNTKMGKSIMRRRLRTKMVLIILDDVDQEEQLEALCDRESFGPGSRIIITSRDEHLLSAVDGDKVYEVNPLTDAEALELFRMKAFKKDQLVGEDFLDLSKGLLKYANGLPLAIKLLGSSVRGKNVKLWSSALDRLKNNPSWNQLQSFLDVATQIKAAQVKKTSASLLTSSAIPISGLPQLVIKDGRTTVKISEDGYQLGLENCKCMLIGRLQLASAASSYSLQDLHQKLSLCWGDIGQWKIIPMGHGYYSFQFASEDCMSRIWAMAAIALKPGTLRFMRWVPNFSPAFQRNTNAQVWVKFWDLGLEYWEAQTLFEIANGIGVPIRIDANTLDRKIGLYARVLVDIDLSSKPPLEIMVGREGGETLVLKVEYEHLPLSCSHCGNVGHAISSCDWLRPSQAKEVKENDINSRGGRKRSQSRRHCAKKSNVSQIYVAKKVVEVVQHIGDPSSTDPN